MRYRDLALIALYLCVLGVACAAGFAAARIRELYRRFG